MNRDQFDSLKEMLQQLYTVCSHWFLRFNDLSIKDKVVLTYAIKVAEDINTLFSESANDLHQLSLKLEDYLSTNWNLISGSMLSYTAMPKSKTTLFLCAIAKEIAHYRNSQLKEGETPLNEMEILFPSLNLESVNEQFPNLCVVRHEGLSEQEKIELSQLQKEISQQLLPTSPDQINFSGSLEEESSERTKKEQYYSLQTIRTSYPKIYEERITKLQLTEELIKKIAVLDKVNRYQWLLGRDEQFKKIKIKEQLNQVKVHGAFVIPNLCVSEVILTHIQSYNRGSLIPITALLNSEKLPYRDRETDELEIELIKRRQMLTKLHTKMQQLQEEDTELEFTGLIEESAEQNKAFQKLTNQLIAIRSEEQQRLKEHSSLTKSYCEAKSIVESFRENKSSLLGHLVVLCKNLRHYDAHDGIGTQENAGAGVYEPIRVFAEYYRTLGYHIVELKDASAKLAPFEIGVKLNINDKKAQNYSIYFKVINHSGAIKTGLLQKQDFPQLITRIAVLRKRNQQFKAKGVAIDSALITQELFSDQEALIDLLAHKQHIDLAQEERFKIPLALRNHIESLLELAQNPEKNTNATANLATCIGTIREILVPMIYQHSVLLARINASGYYLATQLERAEQELNQRASLLKETLDEQKYQGVDNLPLTQTLLKKLDITIRINNLATLQALMGLDVDEITQLLESEGRTQEIIQLFSTTDALFDFIFQHPSSKIAALIETTGSALFEKLCHSFDECNSLLFGQNDEHLKVVLRGLLLYSSAFDLSRYLKLHRDKLALVKDILLNNTDAALAWLNNNAIAPYLPSSSKGILDFKEPLTKMGAFFHIEAKRTAIECIFKGNYNFKQAYFKQAHLFGLTGAANNSIEQVVRALKTSPMALAYASISLQQNKDLKEISAIADYSLRECACDCFLNLENVDLLNNLISTHPLVFSYLPESLRDNELVVLAGINTGYPCLSFASERLQTNQTFKDIALIYQNDLRAKACNCYRYQSDINYIAKALFAEPSLFRFLTPQLRGMERIVLLALAEDRYALTYASPQYKNDACLKKIANIGDRELRRRACRCYLERQNINFQVQEIKKNYKVFYYLAPGLYNNIEVIVAALYTQREAINYASTRLRSDPYLQRLASFYDQDLRSIVCDCYLRAQDIEYVAAEVKKHNKLYFHLPTELKEHPRIMKELQAVSPEGGETNNRYSFLYEMKNIICDKLESSQVKKAVAPP